MNKVSAIYNFDRINRFELLSNQYTLNIYLEVWCQIPTYPCHEGSYISWHLISISFYLSHSASTASPKGIGGHFSQ